MNEQTNSVDFWVEELTKDISDFNISDAYLDVSGYGQWMWNRGYNAGLVNLQTKINTYCIPQWISVKDKLPDNSIYVLVTYYDLGVKDYCFSMGAYHAKENVWVDDTFTKIVNVTAWMPLPEYPKSEDGAK